MEIRLGVIRVDGQGALEAPLGGEPIPFSQKHDLPQRHLCVGTLIIQCKRAKRGSFGVGKRLDVRPGPKSRLCQLRKREAGVCGGVTWIDRRCGRERRHRVGYLEERPRPKMRPTAGNQLGCFRRAGWIRGRRIDAL